ncbi:MAG: LLM class flavin-dependent oxidoreductase [Conexivisphaerales archaeon]
MLPLFGVNINPDSRYVEDCFSIAKLADSYELDIIGVQDHPYNPLFLDTWTLLTALGMSTKNVHLLINVADMPLRYPPMLAKAAASLDLLTKGRVELGLGAGAFWEGIESFGVSRRKPSEVFRAFEEGMKIIRLLLNNKSGEPVTFEGKYYRLKNAQFGPHPYHHVNLWVGGYGPKMLELTGRLGDGWTISLPYLPPQDIRAKKQLIEDAAKHAGRNPASIIVNYNFGGVILEDESQVKPSRPNVLYATIEGWVEILLNFHKLGVTSFNFWPAGEDKVEQVRLFAREVVPKLRRALSSAQRTI